MTENKYFVTHSAGNIICDSISRELTDGIFEEITYDDIVNKLNNSKEFINQLQDELKMFKETNGNALWQLEARIDKLEYDKKELIKENTKLKSSPRVDVNEIESLVCENQKLKLWQNNVFKLIKAKIKVYQQKPVSAPVSNPFSNTYDAEHDRLARLAELESLLQEVLLL